MASFYFRFKAHVTSVILTPRHILVWATRTRLGLRLLINSRRFFCLFVCLFVFVFVFVSNRPYLSIPYLVIIIYLSFVKHSILTGEPSSCRATKFYTFHDSTYLENFIVSMLRIFQVLKMTRSYSLREKKFPFILTNETRKLVYT